MARFSADRQWKLNIICISLNRRITCFDLTLLPESLVLRSRIPNTFKLAACPRWSGTIPDVGIIPNHWNHQSFGALLIELNVFFKKTEYPWQRLFNSELVLLYSEFLVPYSRKSAIKKVAKRGLMSLRRRKIRPRVAGRLDWNFIGEKVNSLSID